MEQKLYRVFKNLTHFLAASQTEMPWPCRLDYFFISPMLVLKQRFQSGRRYCWGFFPEIPGSFPQTQMNGPFIAKDRFASGGVFEPNTRCFLGPPPHQVLLKPLRERLVQLTMFSQLHFSSFVAGVTGEHSIFRMSVSDLRHKLCLVHSNTPRPTATQDCRRRWRITKGYVVAGAKQGEFGLSIKPQSSSWSARRSLIFICILSFVFWLGVAVVSGTLFGLNEPAVKSLNLAAPGAGKSIAQVVQPGQEVILDFDSTRALVARNGQDLVLRFPNNASLRLSGFAEATAKAPLKIVARDGLTVPSDLFLATLDAIGREVAAYQVLQTAPAAGK